MQRLQSSHMCCAPSHVRLTQCSCRDSAAADRDGVVPAGVLVQRRLQHADGVGVLGGLQDAHLGQAQLRQRLLLVQRVRLRVAAAWDDSWCICFGTSTCSDGQKHSTPSQLLWNSSWVRDMYRKHKARVQVSTCR